MKSLVPASALPRRLLIGLGVVLVSAAASGCAQPREPDMTSSISVDGFRTRHPIVVEEGQETLDVPVGPHGARLGSALGSVVEGFGRSARLAGASGIVMMVPSGSANEAAAYRASHEITAALVRAGFAAHAVEKRPYLAEPVNDAAPIRLSYPRMVAHVPHQCGQWPNQALGDNSNADYWNFGCATQANFAAMVANPTDLVAPPEIGAPDATRRSKVLSKYRKGEKTVSDFGLPSPGVSSVGGGSQ
jgi:pilus assembly protein CpaD